MAHYDLEEQEQLAQIKHFWQRHGNLITGALIVVLAALAVWNGWQYWQRRQAVEAAGMLESVEAAAQARDSDRLSQSLTDVQSNYGRTTDAVQASMLAAQVFYEMGQTDAARKALAWVLTEAHDPAYQTIARLRLAAMDIEAKDYEHALVLLSVPMPKTFEALVADRRGDVYAAQGQADLAKAQYRAAWKGMDARHAYRSLVAIKLAALGEAVEDPALSPEAR